VLCTHVPFIPILLLLFVFVISVIGLGASQEIGLEVNTDITKYIVMSRDQNAGRSYSMKTENSSFERAEQFKYLGTILTNQDCIEEENRRRLKSGNACYHSVQNLVFQFAIQMYKH